ncbi:hypothetical protein ACFU99_02725 [Streptomyces sp. NPDC057654]|uniref:hypothetical protein n=1 Tax=Streptomyces sp. NPDC057654 TaxID=3346196 RepID=UPI003690A117
MSTTTGQVSWLTGVPLATWLTTASPYPHAALAAWGGGETATLINQLRQVAVELPLAVSPPDGERPRHRVGLRLLYDRPRLRLTAVKALREAVGEAARRGLPARSSLNSCP